MPKVFCIDGVIVDIPREAVTRQEFETQALMPIEDQPVMAGVLRDEGVELLSPEVGARVVDRYGGMMLQDRNTETFFEIANALEERGEASPDDAKDWPG